MVVLQPACANQSRWTTTNSAYGEFYASVHREVRKSPEPVPHKECTKKAEGLGKELNDVKAKLECLTQRCKREPYPKTGYILPPGSELNPNLFSPKIGKCECPTGPGPPNPNPYISVCKNEFNGAKLHDPQFLEQHIKSVHPRLVKRMSPPKLYSAPCVTRNGDHFAGDCKNDSDIESRSGYKSSSERPRHCKMIGLYKRTSSKCPSRCASQDKLFNNNSMRVKVFENNGNNCNSTSNNTPNLPAQLPNDQRYNFYRYYENCPSGFSLGDIFYNGNESIYHNVMHRNYLKEIFPHIKSCTTPRTNSILTCNKLVAHSVECPIVLNENIKTTSYDICCYDKLSKRETINFSASKVSNCLESSNLPILCSNVKKEMSSLKNVQGTQTSTSTFDDNNKLAENFVESSTLDNTKEKKDKRVSSISKDILKSTQTSISMFDENNKFVENIVEASNVGDTLDNTIESKFEEVLDTVNLGVKSKELSNPRLLYKFDVFATPNHNLHNCSNSGFNNPSIKNLDPYESENEIEESIETKDMDCSPNSLKTLSDPRLCYELEISPRKDGRRLGSFNVNLENEKNIDSSIKCIEIEYEQSQVHPSTNKKSRELCFEVNLNSKAQNDKGDRDIVKDENTNQYNVNIKEIKDEEIFDTNPNIDSFSNSNMSSNFSQHSTKKSNSIDYQLNNEDEQNIMSFSNELNSLDNQKNNHVDLGSFSSKQFIFNPMDLLFLNLCVNYDGHCVGRLKMQTKIDKKNLKCKILIESQTFIFLNIFNHKIN